jgi:hypothetical protein
LSIKKTTHNASRDLVLLRIASGAPLPGTNHAYIVCADKQVAVPKVVNGKEVENEEFYSDELGKSDAQEIPPEDCQSGAS